jgi:hypothetical protein
MLQEVMRVTANDKRALATNRTLLLYSAPIFCLSVLVLFQIFQIRFFGRTYIPPLAIIFGALNSLLFLGSPLCVALGWLRFIRPKQHFKDQGLILGRNVLIAASLLAAPIPIFTIVCFVVYFRAPGSLFH